MHRIQQATGLALTYHEDRARGERMKMKLDSSGAGASRYFRSRREGVWNFGVLPTEFAGDRMHLRVPDREAGARDLRGAVPHSQTACRQF